MSKKSEELQQDQLANRWSTTSNPSAGTTAVCASRSAGALGRLNIDMLSYSVNNSLGAAAVTANVTLRHASAGGSIISQLGVAAAAGGATSFAGIINLPGKINKAVSGDISSPGASVTHNITLAGWEDAQR